MTRLPISVFIIAGNEADRIRYPIRSTREWVEEIVVVDSRSTDATVKTAEELGADKVVSRDWPGYGPQKRYAQSLCTQPWVMNLDADEEITPALRDEIKALFASGAPQDAIFALDIRTVFPGETELRRFAPNNRVKRLYPAAKAAFKDSTVHDTVEPVGDALPVIHLKAPVKHYCFRSYQHMLDKIIAYSSAQAEDQVARGKRISRTRVALDPFFAFFKSYILRHYILFGMTGVVYSVYYAFGRTLRNIKWFEKQKSAGK